MADADGRQHLAARDAAARWPAPRRACDTPGQATAVRTTSFSAALPASQAEWGDSSRLRPFGRDDPVELGSQRLAGDGEAGLGEVARRGRWPPCPEPAGRWPAGRRSRRCPSAGGRHRAVGPADQHADLDHHLAQRPHPQADGEAGAGRRRPASAPRPRPRWSGPGCRPGGLPASVFAVGCSVLSRAHPRTTSSALADDLVGACR